MAGQSESEAIHGISESPIIDALGHHEEVGFDDEGGGDIGAGREQFETEHGATAVETEIGDLGPGSLREVLGEEATGDGRADERGVGGGAEKGMFESDEIRLIIGLGDMSAPRQGEERETPESEQGDCEPEDPGRLPGAGGWGRNVAHGRGLRTGNKRSRPGRRY